MDGITCPGSLDGRGAHIQEILGKEQVLIVRKSLGQQDIKCELAQRCTLETFHCVIHPEIVVASNGHHDLLFLPFTVLLHRPLTTSISPDSCVLAMCVCVSCRIWAALGYSTEMTHLDRNINTEMS